MAFPSVRRKSDIHSYALQEHLLEHRFNKGGKGAFAESITLANGGQPLGKAEVEVGEYAKVFNMASNQFHSVISSPISACIPVRMIAALSSSLASESNTKRINSPLSEMSCL